MGLIKKAAIWHYLWSYQPRYVYNEKTYKIPTILCNMYVHHTVCIMCCLYKCIFGEYTRSHRNFVYCNFVHLQQNVEKL